MEMEVVVVEVAGEVEVQVVMEAVVEVKDMEVEVVKEVVLWWPIGTERNS